MLTLVLLSLILCMSVNTLDNGLAKTPPMGWMTWERFRCNLDCVNDPHNCIRSAMLTLVLLSLILCMSVNTLDNGLAKTPPMGWMTWERFRCNLDCVNDPHNCISEKLIMQMADRMAEDGYLAAGYEYVSIDDCWMSKQRDSEGRLQPDPDRFPSGIKALADYVHSKGLKLGIYGDVGPLTCKKYPGNQNYMPLDAQTYASWGVDMLKLDCCYSGYEMVQGYETMGFFLNKTGRPIMYNCGYPICAGNSVNYTQAAKICNTWRVAPDIQDSWQSVSNTIEFYRQNEKKFADVAGPGQWNDADELIVGDFGLSEGQQKAQMGMWAMFSSQLFMSVDLRNISKMARDILLNKQILAINQDPLSKQAKFLWRDTTVVMECWLKPLSPKGKFAVAVLNYEAYGLPLFLNKTMSDLGLPASGESYRMTDVYTGKTYGPFGLSDRLIVPIPATSIFLAIAEPTSFK